MPSPRLPNYLRSNRKRLALSQDEVAFLLGTQSGAKVCRDERFARVPTLETALAYEVLFRTPTRDLFAGLHEKVELDVSVRAKTLGSLIRGKKGNPYTSRKLQVIETLISSLSHQAEQRS